MSCRTRMKCQEQVSRLLLLPFWLASLICSCLFMALGAFQTHPVSDSLGFQTYLEVASGSQLGLRYSGIWRARGDEQGRMVPLGNLPWCCTDGTRRFLSWQLPPSTAGFLQAAACCGMEYEPHRLSEPNHTQHFRSTIQFLREPTFETCGILSGFGSCLLPSYSRLPPPCSILGADLQSPRFKEAPLHKEQNCATHRELNYSKTVTEKTHPLSGKVLDLR